MNRPYAATICLADHLAQELGCGLLGEKEAEEDVEDAVGSEVERLAARAASDRADRTPPAVLERAREALRLGEDQLRLIREEAETALAERFGTGEASD